jgi:hypothetical protein
MPDDYVTNEDFQKDMSVDRKLIELSDPILRKTMSELIEEKPDILLITGDLTKDGEKQSHETMQGLLHLLENTGIKVFVIPGNNDILNSGAVSYSSISTGNITASQFAEFYGDFGYKDALYRDANSLSYISQPCARLWILGIDASQYIYDNIKGTYSVKPVLNPLTLAWIQVKMVEAQENGIKVLAMMHYGIIEHYAGQKNLEPLIKNSQVNAIALINAGIRLIFTGHYHANDIVEFTNDGKTLTDIQTGSLVTPPSSYRIMTLDDNFIKIETRHISDVDAVIPGGMDFLTYSDVNITSRINGFFTFYGPYIQAIYGIPKEQYPTAIPFLTKAYKAYFAGDERMNSEERKNIEVLAQSVPSSLILLNSLWTDLPPNDNKIHIKMK